MADTVMLLRRPFRKAAFLATAAALCALVGAGRASATTVNLGAAGTYGLLTGTNETLNLGGTFNLNNSTSSGNVGNFAGNIGIGANDTVNVTGTTNVAGSAFQDPTATDNISGTANVSGSFVTQSMTSIISAAATASTNAAALTKTSGLQNQNGSISLNGTSLTIKALTNLSENVLDISSLSLTNGTLIFDDNGFTGAKFIINITGDFTVNATGSSQSVISGINGALPSDILFNITGTSSNPVSITDSSSKNNALIGTILAPARNISLGGGGTLTGAIIAGVNNAGKSYTVTTAATGFNINSYGYTAVGTHRVPEPSSVVLFGTGLVATAFALRRRRRAA